MIVKRILLFLLCGILLMAGLPAQAWRVASGEPDIPVVELSALPPEARLTLDLIQRGGPFPHKRDGVVFQNREHRLPLRPRGYYREYTVPTPGASDRGARRIVSGASNDHYYSADHYRSFQRIKP